jgi:hypothetical protein
MALSDHMGCLVHTNGTGKRTERMISTTDVARTTCSSTCERQSGSMRTYAALLGP